MRQIVLLRGINVGRNNRIPMPRLRACLEHAGFEEVRTYLQSGNVVLRSDRPADELAHACSRLIAGEFGLQIDAVARSRDELGRVVEANPLADVAADPKRYQVSFLSRVPDPGLLEALEAVRAAPERLVLIGRELYAWHPDSVARSKLWTRLASPRLGVTATARNWTTVVNLLAMADEGSTQ